jgi:hypothetical protein
MNQPARFDQSTSPGSERRAHAEELEAAGRFREAIRAWSAVNRLAPDAAIEERLVGLRHKAMRELASQTAVGPWPRQLPDPFPGIAGQLPEIAATALSSAVLGGAILHHGALLVRELIPRTTAADLVAAVDHAFDAREIAVDGAPRSETAPWFAPDRTYDAVAPNAAMQRALNRDLDGLLAVDSPRALFALTEALEAAGVPSVIAAHLGEDPVLAVEKCTLRRSRPRPEPRWHQDGSFLGADVRTVDVWIALSDCGAGTEAAGLEVLPRRLDHVVEVGEGAAMNSIAVTPEDVARVGAGIAPVRPTFAPGDAIMFDELFLHRTMPGLARVRYALEVWMFAASRTPESYACVVL